jgi:DNA-binding MarR family transcriptional regulator
VDMNPDAHLGFLLASVARLMREHFNASAQAAGFTLAQARALVQLSRNEGISQVALAGILEIQPITLLRQIDRLSDMGVVERRRDPSDRRVQQLFLTGKAQPFLTQIWELGDEIGDRALRGLSDEACTSLISTLQQIKHNLMTDGEHVAGVG